MSCHRHSNFFIVGRPIVQFCAWLQIPRSHNLEHFVNHSQVTLHILWYSRNFYSVSFLLFLRALSPASTSHIMSPTPGHLQISSSSRWLRDHTFPNLSLKWSCSTVAESLRMLPEPNASATIDFSSNLIIPGTRFLAVAALNYLYTSDGTIAIDCWSF